MPGLLIEIAAAHSFPLDLARALFWQGERRRYVRKVTALKTVTSVLLMIVI